MTLRQKCAVCPPPQNSSRDFGWTPLSWGRVRSESERSLRPGHQGLVGEWRTLGFIPSESGGPRKKDFEQGNNTIQFLKTITLATDNPDKPRNDKTITSHIGLHEYLFTIKIYISNKKSKRNILFSAMSIKKVKKKITYYSSELTYINPVLKTD